MSEAVRSQIDALTKDFRAPPFGILNKSYQGMANFMNEVLNKDLDNTRRMFSEYLARNGNSFAFGGFANYYLQQTGNYGRPPESGLPTHETQWNKDVFGISEDSRLEIASWVKPLLDGTSDQPIYFAVTGHMGSKGTAIRLELADFTMIVIFCPT